MVMPAASRSASAALHSIRVGKHARAATPSAESKNSTQNSMLLPAPSSNQSADSWKPYWKSKSKLMFSANCVWSSSCVASSSWIPRLSSSSSDRLSWSMSAMSSANVFSLARILSSADES